MSDTLAYSDTLAAFAPAFVALQAALPTIAKHAESHHGKYADLAGTIEVVKPILADHGFAVAQPTSGGQGGFVSVTTILLHTSGEWMRDTLQMPTGGNGAQGVGSAISYARRYALAAILSLAAEDDDGGAASQSPAAPRRAAAKRGGDAHPSPPRNTHPDAATDAQVKLLAIQCLKAGIEEANRVEHVARLVGRPIKSTHDLTKAECSLAINAMLSGAAA